MGAVHIDIKKREREYEYLTLSDENVVRYLILYRSKLIESNRYAVNQELIALYASLDMIIQLCNFKKKQLRLLELLFLGYTIYDVCKLNIGYKKSATYDLFDRIVARIVRKNNDLWRETMERMHYVVGERNGKNENQITKREKT